MIVYEKEKSSSDCFFWQRFGDPDGGAFFTEIVILETKKGFVKKVYDWGFFKSEEIFTYNKPPLSWIINHLFTDTHRDKILSYYNPENITLKVPKTAILYKNNKGYVVAVPKWHNWHGRQEEVLYVTNIKIQE
jgi:hypothetical protein